MKVEDKLISKFKVDTMMEWFRVKRSVHTKWKYHENIRQNKGGERIAKKERKNERKWRPSEILFLMGVEALGNKSLERPSDQSSYE